MGGTLLTIFGVSVSSMSKAQANILQSSAEAEFNALPQVTDESLAIKHFLQQFKSKLPQKVSVVAKTNSSVLKPDLRPWALCPTPGRHHYILNSQTSLLSNQRKVHKSTSL